MSLPKNWKWSTGLMLACLAWPASNVEAQVSNSAPGSRNTGGWRPTSVAAQASQSSAPNEGTRKTSDTILRSGSNVQTAYFQAQGNLSDAMPAMPVLPAGGQGEYGSPGIPAMPNNFGPFPDYAGTGANSPVTPPVEPPVNPPGYQSRELQGEMAPPQLPMSRRGVPAQLASGELRAIQNDRQPNNTASQQQPPRGNAQDFATGLPYVTAAPRSRYATSPYQPAVFQAADYRTTTIPVQLVSNPSPAFGPQVTQVTAQLGPAPVAPPPNLAAAQGVGPTAGQNNALGYLTAQQASLPQNRYPQPGIYPTAYQCTTPAPTFPSTGAVPGTFVPPTLPPNLTPGLYTPNNSGYTPFFSLGQENYNVQLGRGIVGQPTVYVPGQPLRNFMRYLSP